MQCRQFDRLPARQTTGRIVVLCGVLIALLFVVNGVSPFAQNDGAAVCLHATVTVALNIPSVMSGDFVYVVGQLVVLIVCNS